MSFVFLLFLVEFSQFVVAEETTLGIIILSAPKKRPELRKTVSDLKVALMNKPNDLKVTEIQFVKGCRNGCDFPDFDEAVSEYRKAFPETQITTPTYTPKDTDGIDNQEWHFDSLAGVWNLVKQQDWAIGIYRKYLTVNYYFFSALQYFYAKTNVDYVLMLEDDQTFKPNAFDDVQILINSKNKNRIHSRISWPQFHWIKYRGQYVFTIECRRDHPWGAFGTLRSRKELGLFLRWIKFSRMTESEDTLADFLCSGLRGEVEVRFVSHHFGRDIRIPSGFM